MSSEIIYTFSGSGFLKQNTGTYYTIIQRNENGGNTAKRLPCYSLISELHSSVFRICTHSEFGIALAEVKELLKLEFL